jgi:hypothetical protein
LAANLIILGNIWRNLEGKTNIMKINLLEFLPYIVVVVLLIRGIFFVVKQQTAAFRRSISSLISE